MKIKIKKELVTGVLTLFVLCGAILFYNLEINASVNHTFEEITWSDLETRTNNNETVFVYYGSEDCSACKFFSPILTKAADNVNIKIYFLEASENEGFGPEYNVYVTPTLLLFKDGGIMRSEGTMEQAEAENLLTEWKR